MITESKLKRLKINPLVTVKSYEWLRRWSDSRSSMPYKVAPENSFYQNKTHRNYLSKWLEIVICRIINNDGWFAKKIETTGRKIKTSTGKEVWIKSGDDKNKGEPDIQSIIDGRVIYWEVKVKQDRMSKEQKEFKDRMESIGAKVHEVKTLDDFLTIYERYNPGIGWSGFEVGEI